jgi:YidC/Oxa1 family membrane protein insertase
MWNTLILQPMLNVLVGIYSLIGSFAIAIILFTLLIRLVTHPLTVSQMKGTQQMTDLQKSKEWLDIQKKYKDDKQKQQTEQARLMQEKGVNPAGSCLPLLIQFPVIIGLYQAVNAALASSPVQLLNLSKLLYPFIDGSKLIPLKSQFLWMDLSQPERLVLFGFGIPVLSVFVGITQYMLGQVMVMPSASGNPNDQSAQMGKMMNLYMPFMMAWITFSVPAGLALYFVATNVFTFIQYALMGKADLRKLIPGYKPKDA